MINARRFSVYWISDSHLIRKVSCFLTLACAKLVFLIQIPLVWSAVEKGKNILGPSSTLVLPDLLRWLDLMDAPTVISRASNKGIDCVEVVALTIITEHMVRISGHVTVTSGDVSHPGDKGMGSLVFWRPAVSQELWFWGHYKPEKQIQALIIRTTPLGSSEGDIDLISQGVEKRCWWPTFPCA